MQSALDACESNSGRSIMGWLEIYKKIEEYYLVLFLGVDTVSVLVFEKPFYIIKEILEEPLDNI